MNNSILKILFLIVVLICPQFANAENKKVTIIQPSNNAKATSPVKVCMEAKNLIVEPAKNGRAEGKGHHHLLFSSLPSDLTKPLGKNNVIHMGDGSSCRTIELLPGIHSIRALFAYGDHVPFEPYITDVIFITVID